jgi:hypothetical protein
LTVADTVVHEGDSVYFALQISDDETHLRVEVDYDGNPNTLNTYDILGQDSTFNQSLLLPPGVYTAGLMVRDARGLESRAFVHYTVIGNAIPQLSLTAADSLLHAGETLDLSLSASDDETELLIQLDVDGDGVWETDVTTTALDTSFHHYSVPAPGSYTAVLQVRDRRGASVSQTLPFTVLANVAPALTLSSNADGVVETDTFQLSLQASDDYALSSFELSIGETLDTRRRS